MNTESTKSEINVTPKHLEHALLLIRDLRVLLDRDLATLYGVTTKHLNQAVQRNLDRFPEDFMFQLTEEEAVTNLRLQFGTLDAFKVTNCDLKAGQGQHSKYLPYAFTREGVGMLSSVLRSPRAVQANIAIMRAFAQFWQTSVRRDRVTDYEAREERDKEWLRTAFGQTKSARAHLIILQALGLDINSVPLNSDASVPLDAAKFWFDVRKLVETGDLKAAHCLRVKVIAGEEPAFDCFELSMFPATVIAALKQLNPATYRPAEQPDFRQSLLVSGWMDGAHRLRLPPTNKTQAVWAFRVTLQSNSDQLGLCNYLKAAHSLATKGES